MEHMTPKERLEAIMDRKPVDRPACVCPGGMMNMVTAELMEQAGATCRMPTATPGKWRIWQRPCMRMAVLKTWAYRSA